jgi:hypothetical protein
MPTNHLNSSGNAANAASPMLGNDSNATRIRLTSAGRGELDRRPRRPLPPPVDVDVDAVAEAEAPVVVAGAPA